MKPRLQLHHTSEFLGMFRCCQNEAKHGRKHILGMFMKYLPFVGS
jgi:hypothetical protein